MYKKQLYLALAGVGICILPVIIPLVPKLGAYAELQRLKASEELERSRIEERAKTSDALYEAGVMPTSRKLRITNYFDSAKRNPRPDTTLYQDDEIVDVFDATGRCIGRIEEGIWKWKHKAKGICKSVQNIKQSRRK
ncbi:hypothetical protein [Nostoc sp.]